MINLTHFLALPSLSPHSEEQLPLLENDQQSNQKIDPKKESQLPSFQLAPGVTREQLELAFFVLSLIGRLALSPYPSSFACSLHHAMRIERSYSIHVLGTKDYRLCTTFTLANRRKWGNPIYGASSRTLLFLFIALVPCTKTSVFSFLSLLLCGCIASSHPFSSFFRYKAHLDTPFISYIINMFLLYKYLFSENSGRSLFDEVIVAPAYVKAH